MKRIKAAIIGAGSAAMLIHAPYLSINPEVDLAAIADPVEKSAKSVAERFHIKKTYRYFQEMLRKEKPDVVHVATPQSLHSKHSIAAMEAGADVLCEKPMACSLEECDAMIGAAKRTGLKLMIGFMKRWNIGLEKVKEILDSEELGKPFFAYIHHTLKASRIYERWQKLKV